MHSRKRGGALACAVVSAVISARCTSSSTTVTAPTTDKCQISATNAPDSFAASGGTGAVSITTARECTWSIAAQSPWVTITGDRTGQGEATVPYAVGSNPAPAARTAIIDVAGNKVQLSQAAAPCRFNLNRTRDSLPAEGGDATVDVTTLAGCSWSAVSNAAWIAVVAGQNGSASATVRMSVAANSGVARTGQVTVGDQAYTIDQAARVTTPAPSPTPPPTPAPAPTPTPTPPPSGESIDLEGRIVLLGGTCPAVAFWVDGRVVVTSQATDYKRGRCEDLSNGDNVTASGTVRPDRAVDATRIELKKR